MTPTFLNTMARDLLLPVEEVMLLAKTAPHRYKVYEIAKRRGGKRIIAQPSRIVKAMQRWIMTNMLGDMPIHDSALGYRVGKNIADNASIHAPHRFLLKLDFSNFFPSIIYADILKYVATCSLLAKQLPNQIDRDLFARILLWAPKTGGDKCLSIGAPSSPLVSNIMMYNFDQNTTNLCRKHGVAYTRYADDLTFSSNTLPDLQTVQGSIEGIIKNMDSPVLVLNQAKTFYGTKAGRRTVTGLVLSNDGNVSLGRDRKRLLRAMIHRAYRDGVPGDEKAKLLGWLAFANAVEPSFIARLATTYGDNFRQRIREGEGNE